MRKILPLFVFLLGLLSTQELFAKGEIDIIAGQTILRTAEGETGVTYYIHAPENFIKDDLRPVVILFSAGGGGLGILNKIWEGAEEGGWIVIGCDSLRNNFKDRELAIKMEDEILDDIFNHLPHDPERIYMGGMSGGAWRAYNISARREEQFAGILAYGGWLGGTDSQDDPYCENMSVAMINGVSDRGANAWVAMDTESLRKRNCSMKHFAFPGGHQVAPPHVTQMAIDWLDTDWKRKQDGEETEKIPLDLLYVGGKGKRKEEFKSFLATHFRSVSSTGPAAMNLEMCNRADVLILDTVVRTLPDGYAKAMLLTGPTAALTAERYGSKLVKPNKIGDAKDSEILAPGKIREAHRLLWDFEESPEEMNEDARSAFINSLVLIHQYDGYQQSSYVGLHSRKEIEELRADPDVKSEELIRWFPQEVLDNFEYDKERICAYYAERIGYVHVPYGGGQLHIDKEAENLKTPNNEISSVAKWVDLLKGEQRKVAQGLLLRYSGQRIRGTSGWKEWFDEDGSSLEFSDERGYRFFDSE